MIKTIMMLLRNLTIAFFSLQKQFIEVNLRRRHLNEFQLGELDYRLEATYLLRACNYQKHPIRLI
jgi:hypothetical protein